MRISKINRKKLSNFPFAKIYICLAKETHREIINSSFCFVGGSSGGVEEEEEKEIQLTCIE